jgi:branched-chain amino acid transport system ATP-binding protein
MASLLSVRGATLSFGGLQALRAVDFELAAGTIMGVIGPNGAGKTTLFNVIAGQLRPTRGEVLLEGRAITGWTPERIAHAGLVKTFQTSRPFGSMTFLDNVAVGALAHLGSVPAAREQAMRCLELVGLGDKRDTPASGASTGQRKRLEIARALATEPRLLLLDEPFGGVDIAAVDSLVDLLQRIRARGVTVLLIEHNLEAVHQLVDHLVAMNFGRKIAEGSAAAVAADPRVIRAYLGQEDEEPAHA